MTRRHVERFVARRADRRSRSGEIETRAGARCGKQASRRRGRRADAPVSRAALWNVVIPTRGRDALAATKQLVDELAPALPTRAITLCLG